MHSGFGLRVFAIALLATLFIVDGCRRKPQPQVVLYVSADEHIAREVIARFEKQSGISVKVVGDTEAKKTTGLVERLRGEKANPQADVFWSSEIVQTIELAAEGVLTEHLSDATRDWPREWRDGQRRWFAFAARPRVIVFAPERVPEGERPGTWLDLARSTWRGRIAIADPRFGTTGTHLGVMRWHWDREVMPGYFRAWAEGLAANDVRVLPSGNAGVVEAVASGEADVGLTDADDVWAAQARGLKVDLIYPSHAPLNSEGDTPADHGTLLIPNTVARVTGGPNPESARLLVDFLLSEEVERLLADSVSHNVPIRESLRGSHPEYEAPSPLRVEWERAATARAGGIEQFFEAIAAVKQDRAAAAEIKAATSRRDEAPHAR
jgi:iron(III) transport system substrate-binding protein